MQKKGWLAFMVDDNLGAKPQSSYKSTPEKKRALRIVQNQPLELGVDFGE